MIDDSAARTRHTRSRLRIGVTVAVSLLTFVGTLYAGPPGSERASGGGAASGAWSSVDVAELELRVERLHAGWRELSAYYSAEVAPIERVLLRYRDAPELAGRVAAAVVREAKAAGLEPRLLLAVLLVENPWLDPTIRSSAGAVGLMQVMPLHEGGWECGRDLEDIDVNVCHGARIFAHYMAVTGADIERALLRYNGCVTGSHTPDCHQYPDHVFARAGRASVLAWLGQAPSAGSP